MRFGFNSDYDKPGTPKTKKELAKQRDLKARERWARTNKDGEVVDIDQFAKYRGEEEEPEPDDTEEKENQAPIIEGEGEGIHEESEQLEGIPMMQAVPSLVELTLSWYLRTSWQNQTFRMKDEEQKRIARKMKRYVTFKWEKSEKEGLFTKRDIAFFVERIKELDWQNYAELAEELDTISEESNIFGHLEADVSVDEIVDLTKFYTDEEDEEDEDEEEI